MLVLPHLETNVTVSCQNRCVSCNHFVPLQAHRFKASMIRAADLATDLRHFGRLAHAQAWAAIGGEPLLHPDLLTLLRVARASGVADRIELWTNGVALTDQPAGFWAGEFDDLVLSVYATLDRRTIAYAAERCADQGKRLVLKDETATPNFTRILVPRSTEAEATERYRQCWFKTYSRVLDEGVFYRCCTSPFIGPLLQNRPWGADGLRIDDATTEEDLQRFLDRTEPMDSCYRCAGRDPASERTAWREEANPRRWEEASGG